MHKVFFPIAAAIATQCGIRTDTFIRAFMNEHSDPLKFAMRRVISTESVDPSALGLISWMMFLIVTSIYLLASVQELRKRDRRVGAGL